MSNLREAAQQALEAIAEAHEESLDENDFECRQILLAQIKSLRAALAQPDDKAQPVEAWHGERKVTVYDDIVLRSWGPNIETQMSTAPRTLHEVQAAFVWLYAATTADLESLQDSYGQLSAESVKLRAALAEPADKAQPVAWQPLETAPEGVRVLLGPRNAPVVGVVKHMPDWADEQDPIAHVVHYNGKTLVSNYRCSEWMPLPDSDPQPQAERYIHHELIEPGKEHLFYAAPQPPSEQGAELSDAQIKEGWALLEYAAKWLNSAHHGDNCFVSDHYEGDPGDRCNCGKDSLLAAIEAGLAARGGAK